MKCYCNIYLKFKQSLISSSSIYLLIFIQVYSRQISIYLNICLNIFIIITEQDLSLLCKQMNNIYKYLSNLFLFF